MCVDVDELNKVHYKFIKQNPDIFIKFILVTECVALSHSSILICHNVTNIENILWSNRQIMK